MKSEVQRIEDPEPFCEPGRIAYAVLFQNEYWQDIYGHMHRLTQMDGSYRFNVMGYLEKKSQELFDNMTMIAVLRFGFEYSGTISTQEAKEWIRTTPVYRELERLNDEEAGW